METQKDKGIRRPTWRELLILLPFAFAYAFFIVLGDWQRSVPYSNLQNMGRLLLWMLLSYGVLLLFCFLIDNRTALADRVPVTVQPFLRKCLFTGAERQGHWWIWLIFFLICLLCYLPYYLMYFPTWFNNDAVWQMEQALGLAARSNHHPYFHTLIIKVFLTVGYGLFGNYTAAVALYTFFQMALMAAVFGFYLYLLYRKGTRLLWFALAVFFYALLPVNAMLSICMGKDAWFTAALLLFIWAVLECTATDVAKKKQWVLFYMTGLAVCLLRSNGIFIFLGTAFILILSRLLGKGRGISPERAHVARQRLFFSVAMVLLSYLLWQGLILKALKVEPPDTIESLAMPTQHLLCAYVRGGSLTEEEVAMLEAVVPLAEIDEYYNPYLFDMTKNYIREHGNQEVIAKNRRAYAKLWLRVGLRNPMQYLEAEIRQTAGYYALHTPHDQYIYTEYYMVDNPFGIETERKVFTYDDSLAMSEFLQRFQALYNRVWNLGASTWLLLLGLAYTLYRRRNALVYVPCLMLLGSLLLATPVYNEFRYAYGVFAALPFLLAYSFGSVILSEGDTDEKMV